MTAPSSSASPSAKSQRARPPAAGQAPQQAAGAGAAELGESSSVVGVPMKGLVLFRAVYPFSCPNEHRDALIQRMNLINAAWPMMGFLTKFRADFQAKIDAAGRAA